MSLPRISQVIAFLRYYLRLRWRVWKQLHQTRHSLGIFYRWRYWQRNPRLNQAVERHKSEPPEQGK